MKYIKKLDVYSIIVTFIVIFLVLGSLWQWYWPKWLAVHDAFLTVSTQNAQVKLTQELQQKTLEAGAQAGVRQVFLQMKDAVSAGREINISVADKDNVTFNLTLVGKPTVPTSSQPK